LWIFANTSFNNGTGLVPWLSKGDDQTGNNQYELINLQSSSYRLLWLAWDTNNTLAATGLTASNTPPTTGAWHHCVVGCDSANQQIFSQYDGGTRATASLTSNGIRALSGAFRLGEWTGVVTGSLDNMTIDECGLWRRALSTADVANLYNGGAGLPFSSFQL